MRRLFRLLMLAMILLVVALASALTAMRMAIHGREVEVPKLVGLSAAQAEELANSQGLRLEVESRFYSAEAPEGRIMSQLPRAGARVRRGWLVRAAESLGPQRVVIPDVLGQSPRAAEINIRRRGLEIDSVAVAHIPGISESRVVAQSPPPSSLDVALPKIGLLVTAPAEARAFVMPSFVGQELQQAARAIEEAGLRIGGINELARQTGGARIVRQWPSPGHKVTPGTVVTLEVEAESSTEYRVPGTEN